MTGDELKEYIFETFSREPDFPFENDYESAVFRHGDNGKWFALLMKVPLNRLGIDSTRRADVLNVKCDPQVGASLIDNSVFFPAYHMNKRHWLSVLTEKATLDDISFVLGISYDLTAPKRTKKRK